jgi:4-hydroxybenzoate polyprenyltransferase
VRATWRAYGRLLRLSLAPSAAADVLAGLVFGGGGSWPARATTWWLVPASLGVYHGALALNDWNDRQHDARTRADRPLPSGAVSPRIALVLGLGLVAAGVACASLARHECGLWMGAVALLALLYDFRGRGAWIGPLLLGACRAGNLGSGIFGRRRELELGFELAPFLPCAAYGLYVFLVSRLGRMEDAEDARPLAQRPRVLLLASALVLAASASLPSPVPIANRVPAIALAVTGAFGLATCALRTPAWTRPLVERAMGLALRRLLVFTSVVALLVFDLGSPSMAPLVAAIAILCGYPLAFGLRRVFPPS